MYTEALCLGLTLCDSSLQTLNTCGGDEVTFMDSESTVLENVIVPNNCLCVKVKVDSSQCDSSFENIK